MYECYYIHPDNVEKCKEELGLKIAIIARPDWFMEATNCRQLIVETELGVHTRCYLAEHNGIPFLIVYGRFGRLRGMSHEIDFELTQEVISFLGIKIVIGTFTGGSLSSTDEAGVVYVLQDLLGLGGYSNTRNRSVSFKNADMFNPFCPTVYNLLAEVSQRMEFSVRTDGVYACFHGYPRLETKFELELYGKLGCHIVGQTLDPEATLARQAGCHYAALAFTSDDLVNRHESMQDSMEASDVRKKIVREGRERTFQIFLAALTKLAQLEFTECSCDSPLNFGKKRSTNYYYRPKYLWE